MNETQTRPRGLFYCQPLLGIGHLIRSLYICKALIRQFDIDFIYGGAQKDLTIHSPHFHLLQLPSLWIRDLKALMQNPPLIEDPTGKHSFQEIMQTRSEILKAYKQKHYDFIITEMYPFSKRVFTKEIESLLDGAREVNPKCLIICSFRGISLPLPPGSEIKIVKSIYKDYHYILSHADPSVINFKHFFSLTDAIKDKILYTGFVSDPDDHPIHKTRKKQIIVTFGAGFYGGKLPAATAQVAALMPDYQFIFSLGPKVDLQVKEKIESSKTPNIVITDFISNFSEVLSESALSISLGGSTLVDTTKTMTPALVFTETSLEHQFRAERFAEKGAVKIFTNDDLSPEKFKALIEEALQKPFQPAHIDVNGAEKTTEIISQLLKTPQGKADK